MKWEWVTALASSAAVVVAMVAVVITERNLRRDRADRRLLMRLNALVDLLSAHDEFRRLYEIPRDGDEREQLRAMATDEQLNISRARFQALLRACQEPLDLTRYLWERSEVFDAPETETEERLKQARLVGYEYEAHNVKAVRGEIVSVIEEVRAQVNNP